VTSPTRPGDRFRRVDEIFDAALDLPPGEQTALIERECAGDEPLRLEVLELVRAYHRADSVLESPAARVAAPLLDAAAAMAGPAPDRIGAFRVVREIGRGGMGRVFLAERADGEFEQRVAIKLIHDGTPGVLRRFIEERRILALLEHPGIARLVDGGLTTGGLPYFAMELVEGEPIDRWCDARELGVEERLELFGRVCEAVAYAHGRLVIHRDLKPSNILVTPAGQVKLLDFGIAKMMTDGQSTLQTRTGFQALTPEYAAPEQVRAGAVGTATDVYALGVLLYLLLTGERPYDIKGKSAAEIERIVCDEVPARPSSRARAAWRRRMRGDLDLIVMTALQKSELRRYPSPAALADDLLRYRQGRPILARPDSAGYRRGKCVVRHRWWVGAAAVMVAAMAGVASREATLRARAEVEARKAREVERYLVSVFDVADPNAWEMREGASVTARELLDHGARRIDSALAGEPAVQAELRGVLGRVYTNLGLYDSATVLLRQALAQRAASAGPDDAGLAEAQDLLGTALTQLNRYDEAEPLLREALARRRRLLGNAHPATAETIEHLATLLEDRNAYDGAEPLYREALAVRRSLAGDLSVPTANAIGNLGLFLYRKGVYAEAESLHRRALDIELRLLGENHPLTAASMQNLAQTLQVRGSLEEAESYHRRALEAKRKALGDAHPSVTLSLNNLANLLTRQMDRLEEGEALARQALAGDRKTFGEPHSYVAASLGNLGVILRLEGRFREADSVLRQALAMNREVYGEHHQRIALNLGALSLTRAAMGDGAEAIALMRRSLEEYRRVLGDTHRSTLTTMGNLAGVLAEFGDPVEAESLARASLRGRDADQPEQRVQVLNIELALGKAVLAQGRAGEAVPTLQRVVERSRQQFGEGNWRTGDALLTYGLAIRAAGRREEAGPVLRAAAAALDRNRPGQPRLAARAKAEAARLSQR
jgi:serine/threonine-protein kinase